MNSWNQGNQENAGGPQGDPMANKTFVLYIKPGDPVSQTIWQMVVDYPEILVQDATQIHPRPAWLSGVPTAVRLSDKRVFPGPDAFSVLKFYLDNLRVMSGAQKDMVINTVDSNKAFAVADISVHHLAAADERRVAAVPVGQSNRHAMSAGLVSFATDDDPRYYQSGKVSESDVSAYAAQRSQIRSRPMQWKQSLLENGELVNL
jgi:hypothetical protein